MEITAIISIFTFLLNNEPEIAKYIGEFIGLFGPSAEPTEAELQAKRIAEYIHVAIPAWRSVMGLDFGQGELGNAAARQAEVELQVTHYALDWKNEILTEEQLSTIVRTAKGLAFLGIGVPFAERVVKVQRDPHDQGE